ncbi:1,2-phenylacetyl-CoA epoxidase subunit PaaD [Pseudomonas sp. QTF5]|uniref:1,2-phenylacetyl-CoA epoxidase subunit PaaD n=1 Tax=Pseudomonas sp. QTF5 TaxID=1435425 RepID=UPI0004AE48D3|nr:1,2-phenylacetyl-CoA epoxidase subunit PaaD [Pseudomonas sp. QTF5]
MHAGELIASDWCGRRANAEDLPNAWSLMAQVMDPEVPVVSLVDLGIVRDILFQDGRLKVVLTPTYSGCPATEMIKQRVRQALECAGYATPYLEQRLAPAWSSQWITDLGRQRLLDYGIAPPQEKSGPVPCPQCASLDTETVSEFGSTACKALYRCRRCKEPFDYFKCI